MQFCRALYSINVQPAQALSRQPPTATTCSIYAASWDNFPVRTQHSPGLTPFLNTSVRPLVYYRPDRPRPSPFLSQDDSPVSSPNGASNTYINGQTCSKLSSQRTRRLLWQHLVPVQSHPVKRASWARCSLCPQGQGEGVFLLVFLIAANSVSDGNETHGV